MIATSTIHERFRSYWPDYKNADLQNTCKAILKEMGRPIKNPVESVKREWGSVCNFLNNWNGERQKKTQSEPSVKITAAQKKMFEGKICPYCKKPSQYVKDSSIVFSRDFGPIYYCKTDSAWVGVHKGEPTKALGRLANAELRELKKEAHAAFDPVWKSNYKSRQQAYYWLSVKLGIPKEYTHIGFFGVETCKKLIEICLKEMA